MVILQWAQSQSVLYSTFSRGFRVRGFRDCFGLRGSGKGSGPVMLAAFRASAITSFTKLEATKLEAPGPEAVEAETSVAGET